MWESISANRESEEYKKWTLLADEKNNDNIMRTSDLNESQRIQHIKKTLTTMRTLLQNLGVQT